MNHIKQILKWVVNTFTCFLFVILILVIYGKVTVLLTDKSYPNYFGYTFFEVASGSMEPTLYVNDVILVKIGKNDINKDDIITFQSENAIITHRVVFVDNDTLVVKGDNNNTKDRPIERKDVIGKVVKIYSKLGIWKKVLSEPKILLAVFITLLLFDFAISYSNNEKSDEKKVAVKKKKEPKKDEAIEIIEIIEDKKDIAKVEKLLDVTRRIDIEEINNLLEDESKKLNNKEITSLKSKVSSNNVNSKEIPKLTDKEMEFVDYTIRLDLNEISKKINDNLK